MYQVKKLGNSYKLYNTKRKNYLQKSYESRNSALKAAESYKKRAAGSQKYHSCCKKNKCNKQKKKPMKRLTKVTTEDGRVYYERRTYKSKK